MADIFVDSNATGADDGTSFADAYPSVKSFTPSSGDRVLVASDHSETISGNLEQFPLSHTIDPRNPVRLFSVNSSTEAFETGASISISQNARVHDGVVWDGFDIELQSGDSLFADVDCRVPPRFVDCEITKTGSGFLVNGANESMWIFDDCAFILNGTSNAFSFTRAFFLRFRGCTFSGSMTGLPFNIAGGDNAFGIFEAYDCDFSGLASLSAGAMWGLNAFALFGEYINCRLPTGKTMLNRASANIGYAQRLRGFLSGSASSTDPSIVVRTDDALGLIEADTVRVRTGGASDGTTSYSWRVSADSGAMPVQRSYGVESPPIYVYVEGGSSITLTIEVAHDAVGDGTAGALLDDEVWIEGSHPDGASPSFPAGGVFSSLPTGANSDAASSSEVWSGTGVGTKQKVSATFTPSESGYVNFKVVFAPVDTTGVAVNICPKPELS